MKQILIATKNPGKLREIREFLGNDFELLSLGDLNDAPYVDEIGSTFEENSILKAKLFFEWFKMPTIADDGGLEIDFLNGEPGVKSHRWPGYEATDEELIKMALEKLHGVPWEKRTARLRTVGTYCDAHGYFHTTGAIDGYIVEKEPERFEPGYPFRAIFWVPKFNKVYQDLTTEEHEDINHRKSIYSQLSKEILRLIS